MKLINRVNINKVMLLLTQDVPSLFVVITSVILSERNIWNSLTSPGKLWIRPWGENFRGETWHVKIMTHKTYSSRFICILVSLSQIFFESGDTDRRDPGERARAAALCLPLPWVQPRLLLLFRFALVVCYFSLMLRDTAAVASHVTQACVLCCFFISFLYPQAQCWP